MAFRLVARDSVRVPIKGELQGDDGGKERFSFTLMCKRMGAERLAESLKDRERKASDFLDEVTFGWDGVVDADGNPRAFSKAALSELLDTPGVALLAFNSYLTESAAKEKN